MVGMRPDNKAGRGFEIKVSRQQMVPFRRIRFERCAARALIRAGLEQTQPERQSICRKRRQFADRRYALVQKLRQMVIVPVIQQIDIVVQLLNGTQGRQFVLS